MPSEWGYHSWVASIPSSFGIGSHSDRSSREGLASHLDRSSGAAAEKNLGGLAVRIEMYSDSPNV
jgi:hypothetical protein